MCKKYNENQIKDILEDNSLKQISEYVGFNIPFLCETKEGYLVFPNLCTLKGNKKPRIFHKSNEYTLKNINTYLKNNKIKCHVKLNQKYINAKTDMVFVCEKHGDFVKTLDALLHGSVCKYCKNEEGVSITTVWEGNSIYHNRKDIVELLLNKDDALNYSVKSNKKIYFKCPFCGEIKLDSPSKVSERGLCCKVCSTGIPITERMLASLLKALKIFYTSQYSPIWADGKRYDFYIPSLNMIIEVHGEQHYKERSAKSKFKNTLKEEQENDKLKYELAIKNGIPINNYIVIDCRKSEPEWLKNNFIKELDCFFNLSTLDWKIIINNSLSNSIITSICEKFNDAWCIKDIAEFENISRKTVVKYLKLGNNVELCNYNPKTQLENSNKKNKNRSKTVYQYKLNGTFIKQYPSVINASVENNIKRTNIIGACNKKQKTAGGFIWSYILMENSDAI